MKKLLMLLVSLIMVFSVFTAVNANETDYPVSLISEDLPMLISAKDNSIKVMQDGEYIDFTDANGNKVEPQIINDRTMVPFRKIFNSLGVSDENITWIAETRTIVAKKDNIEIELQIENNIAEKTVSGETTTITLDTAPVIYENRTLVPVRFIAESMEKLVGWDNVNRTVIIIDRAKIEKQFEEAMPKYLEIVNLQTTPINTMNSTMVLEGEIAYASKAEKENNSTVKFTADIDVKKSEESVYVKLNIVLSGKGVLYEAVKESGLTKIDATIILNANRMYIKSSLIEEAQGKWMVMEDDSLLEIMTLLNTAYEKPSQADLLAVKEEDLNIYTYESLQMVINMLKEFLGDDKITISGTKTKKYEIKLDLMDFAKLLGDFGSDLDGLEIFKKSDIVAGGTIEDGVAKTSFAEIDFKIAEDGEEIAIKIEADSKLNNYNKTVKIDVPTANEIIIAE